MHTKITISPDPTVSYRIFRLGKYLLSIIIAGYILLGTLLYESTSSLKFTDELFTLTLTILALIFFPKYLLSYWKPIAVFFLSSAGYAIYSSKLGINTFSNISQDLFVSIKPWLAFLMVYATGYHPGLFFRKTLRIISLAIAAALLIIALSGEKYIAEIFYHESRFYSAAIISALVYLLSLSRYRWSSLFASLAIFSIGIITLKAKFLGEWVAFVALSAYFLCVTRNIDLPRRLKWITSDWRILLLAPVLIAATVWIAWEKIEFYFITGIQNENNLFARPALYMKSIEIFGDYAPWGSGLASFGSYFSAHGTYSSLYEAYGLSQLHGLSEDNPVFIADTYFPMLIAQFGLPGIIAFSLFFIWIRRLIRRYGSPPYRPSPALLVISFIPILLLIESIADATLAQNRGVLYMTLLAIAINQYRSGMHGVQIGKPRILLNRSIDNGPQSASISLSSVSDNS